MTKKLLVAPVVVLIALAVITSVHAYSNSIETEPSVIPHGSSTTIVLETADKATGIMKVKDPNGNWHEAINSVDIPNGGGQQTWVYPQDFQNGDTATAGPYEVVADITFPEYTWATQFQVGFLAVPEVPLGTIAVALAAFGALGVFSLKKRSFLR